MNGRAVNILGQRVAPERPGHPAEEQEIEERAQPEEIHIQVGRLLREFVVMSGGQGHPTPDKIRDKKEWNQEECEEGKKAGNVFQLTADAKTPCGVNRMVDNHPEDRSD